MPLSISRRSTTTWSASPARSPASTARQRVGVDDAPDAPLACHEREDVAALAGPQRRVRGVAPDRRSSATSMTNRSSGWTSSLWTPVGATSRWPSVGRPADAPAGARDPVAVGRSRAAARPAARGSRSSDHGPRSRWRAAMAGPNGGRRTPASVTNAVTSSAGVTSNAGFQTGAPAGVVAAPPNPRTSVRGALLDHDAGPVRCRRHRTRSGGLPPGMGCRVAPRAPRGA